MPTIQLRFYDDAGVTCPLHRFNIGLFGRYKLSLTGYSYAQENNAHRVVQLVSPQLTLAVNVNASTPTTALYGGGNFTFITTNNASHTTNLGKEIELNTVLLQGYIEAQLFRIVNGTTLSQLDSFDDAIFYINAEPLDTFTNQNLLN
jgi:hypothetical protein